MKNRQFDQKRSSLDFSDSETEDYKQPRNYSKESSIEDVYSPDSKAYSNDNDSLEGSFKPTPKSILKDYGPSGSKGKKNITINERLNETHRIAQKNDSSITSPDRSEGSAAKNPRYNDYIREETGQSGAHGSHGYSSRSGETYSSKHEGTSDEEDYGGKLGPKYTSDSYNKSGSSFKNRLVVGNPETEGLSDFQRAHVRRLQQEREQELYSRGMRESADEVREKWLEEKARQNATYEDFKNRDRGYEAGEQGIDRLGRYEDNRNKDYGYSSHQKIDTFGARDVEPAEKFTRIEDKIAVLERDLNSYSKNVVQSTLKQEEKNRTLGKVYDEFEERMNGLKEEINQSIQGSKSPQKEMHSRGFSAEESRRSKPTTLYESSKQTLKKKTGSVAKSSASAKLRKSMDIYGVSKKKTNTKQLQQEIEKLRNENYELRNRLVEKDDEEKAKTKKAAKTQGGININREKELLETIERIKSKLRKSITKKVHEEKNRQIEATREDAAAASFGRNYSSYGFNYKDVLKRKAFDDRTTATSNYLLLNKGLPTTYKDYERTSFEKNLTKTKK